MTNKTITGLTQTVVVEDTRRSYLARKREFRKQIREKYFPEFKKSMLLEINKKENRIRFICADTMEVREMSLDAHTQHRSTLNSYFDYVCNVSFGLSTSQIKEMLDGAEVTD